VNGIGIIAAPEGRLRTVIACTVERDKITEMEVIADPKRLRKMNLFLLMTVFGSVSTSGRGSRQRRSPITGRSPCPGLRSRPTQACEKTTALNNSWNRTTHAGSILDQRLRDFCVRARLRARLRGSYPLAGAAFSATRRLASDSMA
jgi:hypothetical protein